MKKLRAILCLAIAAAGLTAAPGGAAVAAEVGKTTRPDAPQTHVGARKETERRFDTLVIGELTYTNVWVHRQTNFNILIRHAGGIDTIRLTDLPDAELAALRPQLGDLANIEEEKEPELVVKYKSMHDSEEIRTMVASAYAELERFILALLLPMVALLVLAHFISSLFIYALCKKTRTKAGLVAWVPVVNLTVLLRAAGLPGVWALLGFMAPLIPVAVFSLQLVPAASFSGLVVVAVSSLFGLASGVVWFVWCFKICLARQKSGWLGLLLLIPGVNVLALSYPAFAD